jgi:hypothetical protein
MPRPSRLRHDQRRPLIAALVLLGLLLSACTAEAPAPSASPPAATTGLLGIRLAKVTGAALKGRPARGPLMPSAERIRQTLAEMYTAGFVDPAQWQSGYRAVLDAFAPKTRSQARGDLNQLTLGGAARSLTSMLPLQARVVIELLPGDRGPVAALANMQFEGVASGGGFEVPVRHEGDYVLKPFGERWLITGYEVKGRIGE